MAILMFGTDANHLAAGSSYAAVDTTAARISPYVHAGVQVLANQQAILPSFTGQTELWFRFYHYPQNLTSSSSNFVLFRGGGQDVARLNFDATPDDITLELWNGSSWVDTGATPHVIADRTTRYRYDVRLNISDTGNFELWVDGTQQMSFSGDTLLTAQTTVDEIRISGTSTSSQGPFSGWFVADENTVDIEMQSLKPTGVGNYTSWNGDHLDVDEDEPDGNTISSDTADQFETYTKTAIDAAFSSGYTVKTLGVVSYAKRAGSGPQNLRHVVRSSTTDGESSNVSNLGTGLQQQFSYFATDPNTAAAWTVTNLGNAEFGVKSIT